MASHIVIALAVFGLPYVALAQIPDVASPDATCTNGVEIFPSILTSWTEQGVAKHQVQLEIINHAEEQFSSWTIGFINETLIEKTVNCSVSLAPYFLGYQGDSLLLHSVDYNSFLDVGASRFISVTIETEISPVEGEPAVPQFQVYLFNQVSCAAKPIPGSNPNDLIADLPFSYVCGCGPTPVDQTPSEYTVDPFTSATLFVEASYDGPLEYTWIQWWQPLSDEVFTDTASLEFASADPDTDQAAYTCVVKGQTGYYISNTIDFMINFKPWFTMQPNTTWVEKGAIATLTVEAETRDDSLWYSWEKFDEATDTWTSLGAWEPTLSLEGTEDNAGEYWVWISNSQDPLYDNAAVSDIATVHLYDECNGSPFIYVEATQVFPDGAILNYTMVNNGTWLMDGWGVEFAWGIPLEVENSWRIVSDPVVDAASGASLMSPSFINAPFNAKIAAGDSDFFGMKVVSPDANTDYPVATEDVMPIHIYLNGVQCGSLNPEADVQKMCCMIASDEDFDNLFAPIPSPPPPSPPPPPPPVQDVVETLCDDPNCLEVKYELNKTFAYFFTSSVYVTNVLDIPVEMWRVSWTWPDGTQAIEDYWTADLVGSLTESITFDMKETATPMLPGDTRKFKLKAEKEFNAVPQSPMNLKAVNVPCSPLPEPLCNCITLEWEWLNKWSSGYIANIWIHNAQTVAINDWRLAFNLLPAEQLDDMWKVQPVAGAQSDPNYAVEIEPIFDGVAHVEAAESQSVKIKVGTSPKAIKSPPLEFMLTLTEAESEVQMSCIRTCDLAKNFVCSVVEVSDLPDVGGPDSSGPSPSPSPGPGPEEPPEQPPQAPPQEMDVSVIYWEGLAEGWSNVSFSSIIECIDGVVGCENAQAHGGEMGIKVTTTKPYGGFSLKGPYVFSPEGALSFWIFSSSVEDIRMKLKAGDEQSGVVLLKDLPFVASDVWSYVQVDISSFQPANDYNRFILQSMGVTGLEFHIDEIAYLQPATGAVDPVPPVVKEPSKPFVVDADTIIAVPQDAEFSTSGMDIDSYVTVPVYDDYLRSEWSDKSWGTEVHYDDASDPYAGSHAISVQLLKNWGAFSVKKDTDLAGAFGFAFWIKADWNILRIQPRATVDDEEIAGPYAKLWMLNFEPNKWTYVVAPLSTFGSEPWSRLVFQAGFESPMGHFLLDELSIILPGDVSPGPQDEPVDTTPPQMTLNGLKLAKYNVHSQCEPYVELGVTVTDNGVEAPELQSNVVITGQVDVTVPGIVQLMYDVSDFANNAAASLWRKVWVISDPTCDPAVPSPLAFALLPSVLEQGQGPVGSSFELYVGSSDFSVTGFNFIFLDADGITLPLNSFGGVHATTLGALSPAAKPNEVFAAPTEGLAVAAPLDDSVPFISLEFAEAAFEVCLHGVVFGQDGAGVKLNLPCPLF